MIAQLTRFLSTVAWCCLLLSCKSLLTCSSAQIKPRTRLCSKSPQSKLWSSFLTARAGCQIRMALKILIHVAETSRGTVFLNKELTKGSKAISVYLSEFVKKEIKKYLESNIERLVTLKSPLIYSQQPTVGPFSSQTLQILFKTLYSNVGINASSLSKIP